MKRIGFNLKRASVLYHFKTATEMKFVISLNGVRDIFCAHQSNNITCTRSSSLPEIQRLFNKNDGCRNFTISSSSNAPEEKEKQKNLRYADFSINIVTNTMIQISEKFTKNKYFNSYVYNII